MYTVEQIRKAGAEGEICSIDTEHLIDILDRLYGSNVSQNSGNAIVSGAFYCQKSIEDEDKCSEQCEHCRGYYSPCSNKMTC